MNTFALHTADNALKKLVSGKAAHYKIALLSENDNADFFLEYQAIPEYPGYHTRLCSTADTLAGSINIDFTRGKYAHRRLHGGGRKQPLARAVGLKPGVNPHVVDMTAGLGRDAFVLASLGCTISLIERNPLVYELLSNAIERASHDSDTARIIQRMHLYFDNATDWLQQLEQTSMPDTIYIDPMYPQRTKSALVKKEMQFFHHIVGQDDDAAQLLETALNSAVKRIVVKRPKSAPLLGDFKPVSDISSRNTRYDIYTGRS